MKKKSEFLFGIERIDEYKELFANKRVGLISNHTGLDQNFNSSIDILKKNKFSSTFRSRTWNKRKY